MTRYSLDDLFEPNPEPDDQPVTYLEPGEPVADRYWVYDVRRYNPVLQVQQAQVDILTAKQSQIDMQLDVMMSSGLAGMPDIRVPAQHYGGTGLKQKTHSPEALQARAHKCCRTVYAAIGRQGLEDYLRDVLSLGDDDLPVPLVLLHLNGPDDAFDLEAFANTYVFDDRALQTIANELWLADPGNWIDNWRLEQEEKAAQTTHPVAGLLRQWLRLKGHDVTDTDRVSIETDWDYGDFLGFEVYVNGETVSAPELEGLGRGSKDIMLVLSRMWDDLHGTDPAAPEA